MKQPKYVNTKKGLADALGVTRPTLNRILNTPGCPGRKKGAGWNLAELCDFAMQHTRSSAPVFAGSEELRALRAEELRIRIARLKALLNRENQAYVDASELHRAVSTLVREATNLVHHKIVLVLPAALGKDDEDCYRLRKACMEVYDDWIRAMQPLSKIFVAVNQPPLEIQKISEIYEKKPHEETTSKN